MKALGTHYVSGASTHAVVDLPPRDVAPGAFAQRHEALRAGFAVVPPRTLPREPGLTTPELNGKGFVGWNPDGTIMFRVLECWLRRIASEDFGGDEVITPTVHRVPDARPEADFGGRQFTTEISEGGEEFQLRHGADFAHLALLRTRAAEAARHPVRIWEYGTYFRRYRSGEVGGLAKLREFHLLDHHTLCVSELAVTDFFRQLRAQVRALEAVPFTTSLEITVLADEYAALEGPLSELSDELGRPILVHVIPARTNGWTVRSYVFVEGPYRTANLQLDRSFAGAGHEPLALIHSSMGSPERLALALSNSPGSEALPFWLSPTQLRILSVGVPEAAAEVRDAVAAEGFRVDIDDRDSSLGGRIRLAKRQRIPTRLVLGEREAGGGRLQLIHGEFTSEEMTVDELLGALRVLQGGHPRYAVSRAAVSG